MNAVMSLWVSKLGGGDFLTSCKAGSFSRRTLLHGVSKQVISLSLRPSAISIASTVRERRLGSLVPRSD
jgi:hypothetical protein